MCEHWKRKETSSEKVLGVTFSLSALWSKKSVPSSLPQAEGTNHMGPLTRLSGSLWSQPTALALTDRWNSKGRHGDSSAGTRLQWEEATLAPTDSGEPGWSSVSCWPHLPLEKKCWPEAYKNYVQEQRGWGGGGGVPEWKGRGNRGPEGALCPWLGSAVRCAQWRNPRDMQ